MAHTEKALQYFSDKFYCSQAVLAAFADDLGLTEEQALRLGACFGSGMRKGEVCGACTGALMVLGMRFGQHRVGDMKSREKTNAVTDRFLSEFAAANSSYICNDLLGCDISTPEGAETAKAFLRNSARRWWSQPSGLPKEYLTKKVYNNAKHRRRVNHSAADFIILFLQPLPHFGYL